MTTKAFSAPYFWSVIAAVIVICHINGSSSSSVVWSSHLLVDANDTDTSTSNNTLPLINVINGTSSAIHLPSDSPHFGGQFNITLSRIIVANGTNGLWTADYASLLQTYDIARINVLISDHHSMYRNHHIAILTLDSCHDLAMAANYTSLTGKNGRHRKRRDIDPVVRCRNAAKKMYKKWEPSLSSGTLLLFVSKRERQAEFIRGRKTPISDRRTAAIARSVMTPKLRMGLFGVALYEGAGHALAYMAGLHPPMILPINMTLVNETAMMHSNDWWYWTTSHGGTGREWVARASHVWWFVLGGTALLLTIIAFIAARRPIRLPTSSSSSQHVCIAVSTSRYVVTLADNADSFLTPDGRSLMVSGLPIALRPEDRYAIRFFQMACGCSVAMIVHWCWEVALNLLMDLMDSQPLPISFSHIATLVVSVACCSWAVTAGEQLADDVLRRVLRPSSTTSYIRPLLCATCGTSLDGIRDGPLAIMSGAQQSAALAGSTTYRAFACNTCTARTGEVVAHLRQLECADSPLLPCARCTTLTVDVHSRICLYCKLDHSQSNMMHIEEQEQRDHDHIDQRV